METFRTCRPMTVEARQCTKAETVATDLGFVNVKSGDWVIHGEDGESYVVDDAFFRRTFTSEPQATAHAQPPLQELSTTSHPRQTTSEVSKIRFAIRSCRRRILARKLAAH
jgi:hypothetical protein